MATKTLNIIESAYRATLEEQDDTIVWISSALRGASAEVDVLLEGSAVNYAVRGQDATGLALGTWQQSQPPRLDHDIKNLMDKGAAVFFVADDAAERGIERTDMVDGVQPIARRDMAQLFSGYGRIWRW
ncbi:MAG: DsrE family protein [Myxococcales bacterium]|nr:DsrE family protein [Myxococcales bacterium]MDD9971867.1 DsrE family protein [Myxococcales bacterium]